MGLLHEIQSSLLDGSTDLGAVLLKLRLLASRLGSVPLEDWVKHESEGYPNHAPVPEYRKLHVSHSATFNGPHGTSIQNAPIPQMLIEKFAGDDWNILEWRGSISSIDRLLDDTDSNNRSLPLERSDLILALQGNVYTGYACNSVVGHVSMLGLDEIKNAVRTKVMALTIELEKSVPKSNEITMGPLSEAPKIERSERVTSITNQVVHGNLTTITSSGHNANIRVSVRSGDSNEARNALTRAGILANDANEFVKILTSETPKDAAEPFGPKASAWIANNIGKAVKGTWSIGVSIATSVLTEVAKQYYGLGSS